MDLKAYVTKVNKRKLQPNYNVIKTNIRPRLIRIHDIKVLLCDVYGTAITSKSSGLGDLEKDKKILKAFKKTIQEFKFTRYLINSKKSPDKLLKESFLKGIRIAHARKGGKYPEVKIELIWKAIIKELIDKGYSYDRKVYGNLHDFSFKVAYFYDYVIEKNMFYDNVLTTLTKLKQRKIKLGIVSNAQFYTPITLEILFRKHGKGLFDLFDKNNCSFSYMVGEGKPSQKMFKKNLERLKNIQKSQILYIGNDLTKDVESAKKLGLKTALFAGDKGSLKLNAKVEPDVIITDWKQLISIIQ